MALGDPYVTVDQLRSRMGIPDSEDDVRLASAVATVSMGIESVTGRQFNDAGSASARVFEPASRVRTVVDDFSTTTGLVVAVDTSLDGSYGTTWASTDYELRPLNGMRGGQPGWAYDEIRALVTRFPCADRASVRVTARWGWAAVPAPVYEACLLVAAETVKLRDAPFGVAGFGDYGVLRVRRNPVAMEMLGPYVRELIG